MDYICNRCHKHTAPATLSFRCDCGGLFRLDYTPEKLVIRQNEFSLWRYASALPFAEGYEGYKALSLGEGLTQTIPLNGDPNLLVKMDYMMPTLSFKDRGAAVLVAKAKELGAKALVADSSGNAGNSIAAYGGRAGIPCYVFVPEGTSPKKIQMISAHGAKVEVVPGTREDTAAAALKLAEQDGMFYASHVYNPFFHQGTKTYAYELYEQFGKQLPDTIVIPTGNGTLLLGCYIGFQDLLAMGLIQKLPRLIAVQAKNCAPIYHAFTKDLDYVPAVENLGTQAEGIAIALPMRGADILEAIRATKGDIITIEEDQIPPVREMLSSIGMYVEPTTAATVAGFLPYYRAHKEELGRCVLPLCGAGLKAK